ncbi:hypothetical protein DRQ32_03595 [bacterium]|nr:MAG: hypothetical protein DRQ32_03595 [bacterium]
MEGGPDLYAVFLQRLEDLELPYFVTGSVASSAWGEPRFTQDLDLVLSLPATAVPSLIQAFPPDLFYVPPQESLLAEAARSEGGHFNLIHHETGIRADVYLSDDDPLHTWAFDHRCHIELSPDLSVWLAPPEYVIVRKLEYFAEGGGERHIGDIRAMIAVLGPRLDSDVLHDWITRRKLGAQWKRIGDG